MRHILELRGQQVEVERIDKRLALRVADDEKALQVFMSAQEARDLARALLMEIEAALIGEALVAVDSLALREEIQ